MAQLAKGVIKTVVGLFLWFGAVAHHSVVVGGGEWQGSVGAGVCEGVGCQLSKFVAEILPVFEKGGEVLAHVLVGVEVVVAIEGFGSGVGCCFSNVAGRSCT